MPNPYDTLEKQYISRAIARHIPLTGNFELLPLCNMNCDMCYVHLSPTEMCAKEPRNTLMSADQWIEIAKQMAEAGTLFVLLTGGEPLLFPDFKKLYLALKELGMIITLNTNGTLINEEWADFFAENRPRRVNITLYGASAETYGKLCHFPDGFEKTIRGIRLLKERGVDVKMSCSVTKQNFDELEDLYRIGEELNIPVTPDTYMLPGLHERDLPEEKQSRLSPEEAAEARTFVLRKEIPSEEFWGFVRRTLASIQEPAESPSGISCQACHSSCAINWQGMLRPCVTIYDPQVDLVKTLAEGKTFSEAWEDLSEKAFALRIHSDCVTCRLRSICENCVGNALVETGRHDGKPEYACRTAKAMERLLKTCADENL